MTNIDLENQEIQSAVTDENIEWNQYQNTTVLITGATGLIGSVLVRTLLCANEKYDLNMKVVGLVRNKVKADKMFADQLTNTHLTFVVADILDLHNLNIEADYIVHTASQTASKYFVEKPVETIETTLNGTSNILNLAKKPNVKGMIFLSTMEVYGTPETDEKINETHATNLETTNVRNCYPISKRMAENLCVSYAHEYHVPVKILRLTQTFGLGVTYNDQRVFAEFTRDAIEGKDIVLHTEGKTKRSYLYTMDAIRAILIALTKAENGEAYNVANEGTYCSIAEMAKMVAQELGNGEINVVFDIAQDVAKFGYAKTLHMNLDTQKIQMLGWKPLVSLPDMFKKTYQYMFNQK